MSASMSEYKPQGHPVKASALVLLNWLVLGMLVFCSDLERMCALNFPPVRTTGVNFWRL